MQGKHTLFYKMTAHQVRNSYSLSLYLQKSDKTWILWDFYIRKSLKALVNLMQKKYGITVDEKIIKQNLVTHELA